MWKPKKGMVEDLEEKIYHLKRAHSMTGTHCHKHPKGGRGCRDCGSKKYIKTSIGEALRLLKIIYKSHA